MTKGNQNHCARLIAALPIMIVAALLTLSAAPAQAHTRSQSFSTWTYDGVEAHFVFTVDARRITQLASIYDNSNDLSMLLSQHLRETITLRQGKAQCSISALTINGANSAVYRAGGYVTCPAPIDKITTQVSITAFHVVSPTHIHITRINSDAAPQDIALSAGRVSFSLNRATKPQHWRDFIGVGFFHVLSGLDHLAFLAALTLIAPHPRRAILCVTGFTVGHSATLGLVALQALQPNEALIEALIGLTIALAAFEAGVMRGAQRALIFNILAFVIACVFFAPFARINAPLTAGALIIFTFFYGAMRAQNAALMTPLITALFGLIHGAGFAGGFIDKLSTKTALIIPLIGFNIGVEAAQLTILFGCFAGYTAIKTFFPDAAQKFQINIAYILSAVGIYWFTLRIWS